MISLTLRVVGNEWCEAQTLTFHRMRSPRWIPFNMGPFFGSGLTREAKRSLERRSGTCSMVLVVLRCVWTHFRVPFTCPWIGPPGALSEKASVRVRGALRLKQDTSEMRPDASLITLAPGGIFRVPYWAPFDASVIR
ncbi:hypothetical protein CDL15_Pgr011150 [Punica granatum]|uniref:Uncharacterized protein n=1 Tax=Punica granatum TaxID=22663 RepID=A0A218WZ55_PUNGR|nr:hypothetical protein CDL15_Pgr011150 [Punica granatum]PKI77636.1 hypothetical protein CRG98_001974 [Punica granatum]